MKSDGTTEELIGLYLLSDNGYHKWRCLQCPQKLPLNAANMNNAAWTEMAESLRKDVECFFGALTLRFEILNSEIRLHNEKAIDYVFLTCCALHNQLLEWDGLDDWMDGVPQQYVDSSTDDDDDDDDDVPSVFRRVFIPGLQHTLLEKI